MGASCSIALDQCHNQSIPVELVTEILLYLPFNDLASCRRVNRTLNDIINSSAYFQHQFDTALAGIVDNPNATLSLPERRHALALRQEAWNNYKPQHIETSNHESYFPNFIQNGIYFRLHHPDFYNSVAYRWPSRSKQSLEGLWSCLSPLPRQNDYDIDALAVCLEENDLVAVGIR